MHPKIFTTLEQVATSETFAATFNHLADMKEQVGKELGLTEWLHITQERIDHFAQVTDDLSVMIRFALIY